MRKSYYILSCFFISMCFFGQKSSERFPVFPNCKNEIGKNLESCFYREMQKYIFKNFTTPNDLPQDYKGIVTALFEVNEKGVFKLLYTDSDQQKLIEETKRVFAKLPTIQPATYNDRNAYKKFSIKIAIPLQDPANFIKENNDDLKNESNKYVFDKNQELKEIDSILYKKFSNPKYKSNLNIPFSHNYYSNFDATMNIVGANNHTASKPFTYKEVIKYNDLEKEDLSLLKNKQSWWGKKLWNENTVAIEGEDYWFTMNPIFDLQVGKTTESNSKSTFVNTRALQINGGIGSNLNFTTTLYETQAHFAEYYNQYAISIKPSGGNPAIIPGIGIAKEFKTDSFDMPMAEANLTFAPSQHINLQLGYGRNFIGDGYRSLLMSDGASPYPFFKINSTFWKIKYTNLYMWLKDVRDAVTVDRTYATKYVASHYLSWNVNKRFNLGFFESVVWSNQNNRGFDFNFVNPIIFYRSVEFGSSSRSGNALLGITGKYKWNSQVNFYGQFLVDEFSMGDIKSGNKSWKNKFAYQIGAKYYHAFSIKNLLLQVEYNHIRPYVYAHSDVLTNYGHNNQSLGHQWGANAKEIVVISRFKKGRYFAEGSLHYGIRGLDFDTPENTYNYGGNIYKDYEENRPFDSNVTIGQGNKTNVFIAQLQAGYLINPQTNLKLFGSMLYRNFSPSYTTNLVDKQNTLWFSVGVRCDVFNWYYDY